MEDPIPPEHSPRSHWWKVVVAFVPAFLAWAVIDTGQNYEGVLAALIFLLLGAILAGGLAAFSAKHSHWAARVGLFFAAGLGYLFICYGGCLAIASTGL